MSNIKSTPSNKSELFIYELGKRIEVAAPDILKYDEENDEKFPMRKLFTLVTGIVSDMMIGKDKFDLANIPFQGMISEYKRLKKIHG